MLITESWYKNGKGFAACKNYRLQTLFFIYHACPENYSLSCTMQAPTPAANTKKAAKTPIIA